MGQQEARFVACCDIVEENARNFATAYGCDAVFTDPAEMYAETEYDAVVMATWPAQHLEQVTQAIAAGARFILCEKALATSAEDAAEIWRRAQAAGVTVVEGFMYLHHPLIGKLEEELAGGAAGPIDWVRSTSSFFFPEVADGDDPNRSWRFRKATGGGVPWDLLCYPVNACSRYVNELPLHVSAIGTHSARYGTINRIFGTIGYENERFGVVESSACAMFNQELELHARTCVYRLDTVFTPPGDAWVEEMYAAKFAHVSHTRHDVLSGMPLQDDLPSYRCYQDQMERFLKVMAGEVAPKPALSHSAVNVAIIEALVDSLETGKQVDITIPDDLRTAWMADRSVLS